ncbi:MAG: hypothetical protein M1826_001362 [Phylliscum demangeonii]|nr:MAG: hypothetical protein M1826_001362 [Phylliscum demangeonii]
MTTGGAKWCHPPSASHRVRVAARNRSVRYSSQEALAEDVVSQARQHFATMRQEARSAASERRRDGRGCERAGLDEADEADEADDDDDGTAERPLNAPSALLQLPASPLRARRHREHDASLVPLIPGRGASFLRGWGAAQGAAPRRMMFNPGAAPRAVPCVSGGPYRAEERLRRGPYNVWSMHALLFSSLPPWMMTRHIARAIDAAAAAAAAAAASSSSLPEHDPLRPDAGRSHSIDAVPTAAFSAVIQQSAAVPMPRPAYGRPCAARMQCDPHRPRHLVGGGAHAKDERSTLHRLESFWRMHRLRPFPARRPIQDQHEMPRGAEDHRT